MLDPAVILIVLVVFFALAFDFVNGLHDTANAVATVIATRVLRPQTAIMMAAVLNMIGALVSTAVAKTIAGGLIQGKPAEMQSIVLAAVIGAITWQVLTWYYGIPSSSSHAIIGGLCGAAIFHSGLTSVQWWGVLIKVIVPLVASPMVGFVFGFLIMSLIFSLFGNFKRFHVSSLFARLQVLTAGAMAFAHGSNDAQKSMGIITLALVAGGFLSAGSEAKSHRESAAVAVAGIPDAEQAPLEQDESAEAPPKVPGIPNWVIFSCALAMALGTATGGHRIIKTMGHKIIRLEPVHGSAAEMSAAATIEIATHLGMPVSTTQVISGSIFGVGSSKRLSAVHWDVAQTMVVAWVLTLPAAGLTAGLIWLLLRWIGLGAY